MNDLPPILVAEDSDDDFFFFCRAARTAGIENPILRFRDGDELVRFIAKLESPVEGDAPMLVFVDLAMPVMNGFQVLEWLQQHESGRFLTVVLSGSSRQEDIAKAYALGAEEYLVKPLSPLMLAALAVRPASAAR
jgi:CheY-like chemotaxis protein